MLTNKNKYLISTNITRGGRIQWEYLENIYSGVSDKVVAIGDGVGILKDFFSHQNFLIVMDKSEVDRLNKITKIDYSNVDDLYSNNLKKLFRVSGIKLMPNNNIIQLLLHNQHITVKLKEYIADEYDSFLIEYPTIDKFIDYINHYTQNKEWYEYMINNELGGLKGVNIRNLNDFCRVFKNVLLRFIRQKEGINSTHFIYFKKDDTFKYFKLLFTAVAMYLINFYKEEGEYLIKKDIISNKTIFNIPKGSYIFIKTYAADNRNDKSHIITKYGLNKFDAGDSGKILENELNDIMKEINFNRYKVILVSHWIEALDIINSKTYDEYIENSR